MYKGNIYLSSKGRVIIDSERIIDNEGEYLQLNDYYRYDKEDNIYRPLSYVIVILSGKHIGMAFIEERGEELSLDKEVVKIFKTNDIYKVIEAIFKNQLHEESTLEEIIIDQANNKARGIAFYDEQGWIKIKSVETMKFEKEIEYSVIGKMADTKNEIYTQIIRTSSNEYYMTEFNGAEYYKFVIELKEVKSILQNREELVKTYNIPEHEAQLLIEYLNRLEK